MGIGLNPFSFVVTSLAGWMNRQQQDVIEYLIEENRVLREQIGNKRMRFTDDQRRRLAIKAKELSRKVREIVAKIVTPETLMAWHRKLIAQKYDGTAGRKAGGRAACKKSQSWLYRGRGIRGRGITQTGVNVEFRERWLISVIC